MHSLLWQGGVQATLCGQQQDGHLGLELRGIPHRQGSGHRQQVTFSLICKGPGHRQKATLFLTHCPLSTTDNTGYIFHLTTKATATVNRSTGHSLSTHCPVFENRQQVTFLPYLQVYGHRFQVTFFTPPPKLWPTRTGNCFRSPFRQGHGH